MAFGLLQLLTNCTYIGSRRRRSSSDGAKAKRPLYTILYGTTSFFGGSTQPNLWRNRSWKECVWNRETRCNLGSLSLCDDKACNVPFLKMSMYHFDIVNMIPTTFCYREQNQKNVQSFYFSIFVGCQNIQAQCTEMNLNKITKTINEILAGFRIQNMFWIKS